MKRRLFLQMLSLAPAIPSVTRVFLESPKSLSYSEISWEGKLIGADEFSQFTPISFDEINALTIKKIVPRIVDEVFRVNPLLVRLKKSTVEGQLLYAPNMRVFP